MSFACPARPACSTGEFTFDVCWCLDCLPRAFNNTDFTITMSKVSDNVSDMPGGPYAASMQV